jgi:tRNA modification GTPase
MASLLELELDFTEEGIDLLKKEDLIGGLENIIALIQRLIDSYELGRIVRDGVKVVLAGRPNVGKSSILNSLLNYERAIVSEIPGTTRDTLEENVSIGGLLFSITDTAGLRESFDKIEEMGVERAKKELQNADVILLVMDSSAEYLADDFRLVRECELEAKKLGGRLLILENKIDLPGANNDSEEWRKLNGVTRIRLSAKSGEAIDKLRSSLLDCAQGSERSFEAGSSVITNQRHKECLSRANAFLETALAQGRNGSSPELIADNLNLSTKALGEIIGEVTSEDVLNNIFSHFCIGK